MPEISFAAIRERVEVERDGARLQLVNSPSIGDAAVELSQARRRLEEWRIDGGGWSAVGAGLGRSYRRGRKAFQQAQAKPTPENMHAWRKRTKDVWYQLRLLAPIAPGSTPSDRGRFGGGCAATGGPGGPRPERSVHADPRSSPI